MWENTTASTELPRDFCAGIGPLQLGVVLVFLYSIFRNRTYSVFPGANIIIHTIFENHVLRTFKYRRENQITNLKNRDLKEKNAAIIYRQQKPKCPCTINASKGQSFSVPAADRFQYDAKRPDLPLGRRRAAAWNRFQL